MRDRFIFTYEALRRQYQDALSSGYEFLRCVDYHTSKVRSRMPAKSIVNRIDIDFSVKKTEKLVDMFNDLGIKGSFFLRLHAPEYNPFAFENYRIIRKLIDTGHELGYHSEVVDQSVIWGEDAADCLVRDIETMQRMFGLKVSGVASHGGMTGLNNLDFWKERSVEEFGLLYEAYDRSPTFNLFHESFYISDSEWTRWKCYENGKLCPNDNRTFGEHLPSGHPLIYLLIHPDTYYTSHFYE